MPPTPGWFPVRVTHHSGTWLADDAVPRVKLHFGRLGRFLPRSAVPPFEGTEAWFHARRRGGRWEFGERCDPKG